VPPCETAAVPPPEVELAAVVPPIVLAVVELAVVVPPVELAVVGSPVVERALGEPSWVASEHEQRSAMVSNCRGFIPMLAFLTSATSCRQRRSPL
jgi:hypothetical protein